MNASTLSPEIQRQLEQLAGLSDYLKSRIKGQDHVIVSVVSALHRAALGLNPPNGPRASLLFLGPTGVGKTELTLALGEFLYGKEAVARFDMSEFQHRDSVKNFIGDETGYLGRLGDKLSSPHHRVLLFDEIEKAHPLIWDLFLQMLEPAQITLGQGKAFDLASHIIVATSNIGSADIMRQTHMPFTSVERFVLAKLARTFRPELVARFQETLVFQKLSYDTQRNIAKMVLDSELTRLEKSTEAKLQISSDEVQHLIRHGINRQFGARPMQKCVRDLLTRKFLET